MQNFSGSEKHLPSIKQIHTFTSNILFEQQYVAGEHVDLLDDHDFPAKTITETYQAFEKRP